MTKHSESETPEPSGQDRVDRTLRIYLSDSSLWPVVFAALATSVTLGTWLLWLVIAGRNGFGALALLLLLGMSCDLWIRELRRRRFGIASRIVLGWWGACIAGAVALEVCL